MGDTSPKGPPPNRLQSFNFPVIDYEQYADEELDYIPLQRGREYTIDARSFASCDTLDEALVIPPTIVTSQATFDDEAVCSDCNLIAVEPYADNRLFSNNLRFRWKKNWSDLMQSAAAGCPSCCGIKALLEFEAKRASGMSVPHLAPIMISSTEQGQYVPTKRDACGSIMVWFDWKFYGNHFINPVWLTCFTYSDDVAAVDTAIVARQPASHSGSDQSLQWIKRQLEICESTHASCRSDRESSLPTRIVHVGSDSASSNPKLVISRGRKGRYVGLSHCWGKRQPFFKLTNERLASFQHEIVFDDLPLNFQDAIRLTRRLGIDYIWIDALCIVQDDINDWAAEAPRMASIYSHATVTVVASGAESCHDGFLRARPLPSYEQFRLRYATSETKTEGHIYLKPEETVEDQLDVHMSQPLQDRGWCLQERLLSIRAIHFDAEQLVWQCRKGILLESRIEFIPSHRLELTSRHSENRLNGLSLLRQPTIVTRTGVIDESAQISALAAWYRIVNIYAAKLLTSSTDVLPAFAGLATHFEDVIQSKYLAGLWECSIVPQLLWSMSMLVGHHLTKSGLTQLESTYAPSWSWASRISLCDGVKVSFRSDKDLVKPSFDRRFMTKYVRCDLKPRFMETGTKGQMTSAKLVLEGPTKSVSIFHGADGGLGGPHVCCTSTKIRGRDKDWHQWIADLDPDFQSHCARRCTRGSEPILSASILHDCGQLGNLIFLLLETGRNWRGLVLQAVQAPGEENNKPVTESSRWRRFVHRRPRDPDLARESTDTSSDLQEYLRVGVFDHQPRPEHRLPGNTKESSQHAMDEWDVREITLI